MIVIKKDICSHIPPTTTSIENNRHYSRFYRNYEANASEFLENREEYCFGTKSTMIYVPTL